MGPMALLHWKRVAMHFLVMLSICVLNVSLLSSVIPSSLTSLLSSIVSPQTSMGRRDHFLFHVNMTFFCFECTDVESFGVAPVFYCFYFGLCALPDYVKVIPRQL